jgi:hypothetical protein
MLRAELATSLFFILFPFPQGTAKRTCRVKGDGVFKYRHILTELYLFYE